MSDEPFIRISMPSCVDCRHADVVPAGEYGDWSGPLWKRVFTAGPPFAEWVGCKRVVVTSDKDVISGYPHAPDEREWFLSAKICRKSSDLCGLAGRWFQLKGDA